MATNRGLRLSLTRPSLLMFEIFGVACWEVGGRATKKRWDGRLVAGQDRPAARSPRWRGGWSAGRRMTPAGPLEVFVSKGGWGWIATGRRRPASCSRFSPTIARLAWRQKDDGWPPGVLAGEGGGKSAAGRRRPAHSRPSLATALSPGGDGRPLRGSR